MGVALARSPRGARLLPSEPRLPDTVLLKSCHPFMIRCVCLIVSLCIAAEPVFAVGPFPDRVAELSLGEGGGFNEALLPEIVLGGPRGAGMFSGSLDVLSLGRGGQITLEFVGSEIVDGPGLDFTVFENAFMTSAGAETGEPFAEPGRVLVSDDGVQFSEFPCALDDPAQVYPGCAGIYPVFANSEDPASPSPTVPTTTPITGIIGLPLDPQPLPPSGSGGDSFDLADVGLGSARFVRIVSGPGALPPGIGQAGFDLDAVVAVNWERVIDEDPDGDRVLGHLDNCPAVANPEQLDTDGDETGDACDPCSQDPTCGPLVAPAHFGGKGSGESERFLTFAAPAARKMKLSADVSTAEVWVNFGPAIKPETLRVKIRGRDATQLFLPGGPGTSQRVSIPLQGRKTRVVFRIKGTKSDGRIGRDLDRLVFRRGQK